MAGGVRVLRAKGRTERIDIGERAGKCLAFELSAHGQVGGTAEEIDLRLFVDIAFERGHAEHFTGALAIAGGDDGGVHVHEVTLLKKLMNRKSQFAAGSKDRAEQIRARAQVGDGAQELLRMPLFLERITGLRRADQLNARSAQFPFLSRCRGRHQVALDYGGGPGREMGEILGPRRARIHHDLQVREAGAIVQFEKGKTLRIAPGANPALDDQRFLRFGRRQNVFNEYAHEGLIACCAQKPRRPAEPG